MGLTEPTILGEGQLIDSVSAVLTFHLLTFLLLTCSRSRLAYFCFLRNRADFEIIEGIVWLEEVWSWLDRRAPKPKGAEGSSTCLRSHGATVNNVAMHGLTVHRPLSGRGGALKSSINAGPHDLIGSCPFQTQITLNP